MHKHSEPVAAVIYGIGAALPSTVVSNAELCARLDTTDEWIRSRTGIAQRHIADADSSTEDLAVKAAKKALPCSGSGPVQALVLATTTPDRCCPATAATVASRLGLTGIPALDLAAGCAGFLYGLSTAAGFIATRTAEAVLVIGADRLSTLPAQGDRTTVPLFGDGAGAVALRRGQAWEDGAIGPVVLGSDGAHAELIRAARPGTLRMQGAEVFRRAVDRMSSVSVEAVAAAGWRMEDVDRLAPHQANARITSFVARQLAVPDERQLHNVGSVGNTGAASIPLLLAQAAADGRLKAGHRLVLTAFGAGLTWGATTVTWPDLTLTPTEGDAVNGDLESILVTDLKLSADRLTPEATLDAAGFDSLAIVELSVLLGDRFGIDVTDADIKGAATLEQLEHLIQRKRDER